MLDSVHNQGLRLCLGAFRTFNGMFLPKHPTHGTVFDNKYMKLFDAKPNVISTFWPSYYAVLTT